MCHPIPGGSCWKYCLKLIYNTVLFREILAGIDTFKMSLAWSHYVERRFSSVMQMTQSSGCSESTMNILPLAVHHSDFSKSSYDPPYLSECERRWDTQPRNCPHSSLWRFPRSFASTTRPSGDYSICSYSPGYCGRRHHLHLSCILSTSLFWVLCYRQL